MITAFDVGTYLSMTKGNIIITMIIIISLFTLGFFRVAMQHSPSHFETGRRELLIICSKFQALIRILSYSGKIEYAFDACGSQFTSRIMTWTLDSMSVPKQQILGPKTNQTD